MDGEERKATLVINMFGAPGAGKSTTAALTFGALKNLGVDAELVSEFAKDLVWECRSETFKDELYIFAKQNHRMFRLNGKVDVIVTDHPLLLSAFYASGDNELAELCKSRFASYDNLNILLERSKPYNPNGRNQTEAESDAIGKGVAALLDSNGIPYVRIKGDSDAAGRVVGLVKERKPWLFKESK